jgi:hypothetical protein
MITILIDIFFLQLKEVPILNIIPTSEVIKQILNSYSANVSSARTQHAFVSTNFTSSFTLGNAEIAIHVIPGIPILWSYFFYGSSITRLD